MRAEGWAFRAQQETHSRGPLVFLLLKEKKTSEGHRPWVSSSSLSTTALRRPQPLAVVVNREEGIPGLWSSLFYCKEKERGPRPWDPDISSSIPLSSCYYRNRGRCHQLSLFFSPIGLSPSRAERREERQLWPSAHLLSPFFLCIKKER